MTIVDIQEPARRGTPSLTKHDRGLSSLLGPTERGMRVKVSREEFSRSDIVEIASRRCAVGSALSCDVRINEPGVAPVECLIFHGSKNNVVRWLDASQEFTGGELFEDEILRAGDPLQIGPVELELLLDEIMESEESVPVVDMSVTSEDRLAEYILRLERLELQLVELQQASDSSTTFQDRDNPSKEVAATISALSSQLADLQTRSVEDRGSWSAEKADLEALLRTRLREFDALQADVQRLRDELQNVRDEYENVSAKDESSERLAEVSQELTERKEEFELEQASWQNERTEFQRHLQENMDRLEQFESQLAEQNERHRQSDLAREAAEARADRLQESVEELSKRLAEQQDEYEAVRATWDAERATLESELVEVKRRLAESVATESMELELRDAWDREKRKLQTQIDDSNARLEEAQTALETQRREFTQAQQRVQEVEHESRDFKPASKTAHQPFGSRVGVAAYNPMDRLLATEESGEDPSDEFDDRLRSFTTPVATKPDRSEPEDIESDYPASDYSVDSYRPSADDAQDDEPSSGSMQSAAYLNDESEDEGTILNPLLTASESQSDDDFFDSSDEEEEEIVFESATSTPPVSTADVLARLGQTSDWNDGETEVDDSRFAESETTELQFTPVEPTPFDSSAGERADASSDEEESIEAYMARLMNRVRATDVRDEPAKRLAPVVERGPVTEYTEVKKAPEAKSAPEVEKFNPEEYKPRSQAPEAADRMTAMRSLANDSARSAIASHAKRNWSSVMKLKLTVSVFAFFAVLASVVFFWGKPVLMGLGSLVGIGVLVYWARTVVAYRRLLFASLMLDPESGDDESPSDG